MFVLNGNICTFKTCLGPRPTSPDQDETVSSLDNFSLQIRSTNWASVTERNPRIRSSWSSSLKMS